jgi:hypothetical protein
MRPLLTDEVVMLARADLQVISGLVAAASGK